MTASLRPAARLTLRLAGLLPLFLLGLVLEAGYRLALGHRWYLRPAGRAVIQAWMRAACAVIGLRVEYRCPPCDEPALLVANHVSWLDILVIHARATGVSVAKSDVRSWPVIGLLATLSGTRFIARNTLSGLNALMEDLAEILRQGGHVILFPEGTSTTGGEVRPFSPALFQCAISASVSVQALTLEYRREGERDPLAPFVGDDAFLPHLLKILRSPRTHATVTFAPPVRAEGCKRRSLARYTRDQISQQLDRGHSPPVPVQGSRTARVA